MALSHTLSTPSHSLRICAILDPPWERTSHLSSEEPASPGWNFDTPERLPLGIRKALFNPGHHDLRSVLCYRECLRALRQGREDEEPPPWASWSTIPTSSHHSDHATDCRARQSALTRLTCLLTKRPNCTLKVRCRCEGRRRPYSWWHNDTRIIQLLSPRRRSLMRGRTRNEISAASLRAVVCQWARGTPSGVMAGCPTLQARRSHESFGIDHEKHLLKCCCTSHICKLCDFRYPSSAICGDRYEPSP